MDLIIVESPTKANTIKKFLGSKYKVLSSYGHIRDLPKSELGIDTENDFEPKYVIPTKARKVVSELKKEAKKADNVILATDEDREGEAISWHLSHILDLKDPERIVFHEITKTAIQEALKNPRKIDMDLSDAQQARRVLDRLVGYKLSPFLWKKVARRLSAGRVQSIAVRLVAEREEERKKFKKDEFWTIKAILKNDKGEIEAFLAKEDGKTIEKLEIKNEKEAEKIKKNLEDAEYKVVNIEKKQSKKNPPPPFITSTLQQESWKRFRMPAKFTMRIAQQLYEKGHITYHRTDSVSLSQTSLFAAKDFIKSEYGEKYWAGFFRKFKSKGKAQEAHEAIRPAVPEKSPDKLKLDSNLTKIYDLIWRRFMASQMQQALFDATSIEIGADKYSFQVNGQMLKFDGFLKVYPTKFEETDLPPLEEKDVLDLVELNPEQHFTQPPPRYNEASLIKALEENEIGRPSTYAPILSTVQDRNYIAKDDSKRFYPTEIGTVVNDLLVEHFPKIVDYEFTAKMENDLDEIAEGKKDWTEVCRDFYGPFEKNLEKKYKEVKKSNITEQPTGKKCPECGSDMIIRIGKFGRFLACSGFPKCKHTDQLKENDLNIDCPKCKNGEVTEKRTRKGKIFYGCDKYPDCDFALWDKPSLVKDGDKHLIEECPDCKLPLVEGRGKIKCSGKDCKFEKEMVEKGE